MSNNVQSFNLATLEGEIRNILRIMAQNDLLGIHLECQSNGSQYL